MYDGTGRKLGGINQTDLLSGDQLNGIDSTSSYLLGTRLRGRLLSGGFGTDIRGCCCGRGAALVGLDPPDVVYGLPEFLVGVHVHLGLALRAPDVPRGLEVILGGGGDIHGNAVEVWNNEDLLCTRFNL